MQISETNLEGVVVLTFEPYFDERGLFLETFDASALSAAGIKDKFTQDAVTASTQKHTLRGLHFQSAPHGQAKIVRCEKGRFFDVAVDIRKTSQSFGEHFSIELSDTSWTAIYLPIGIAHGVCTLEDDTRVSYKIAGDYAPDHGTGIVWNDPSLNIQWPIAAGDILINDRDAELPVFNTQQDYF